MISKPRSLRVPRNPIGLLILLAAFAAAAGCSNSNTPGGGGVIVNHVDASGNSIPGWLTPTGGLHTNSATLDYIANGGSSSCTECHGSDLTGGISRVSCFANTAGCHHGPIPNWSTAAVHGATAKLAPGSSGFASCQICHGNNFSGGGAGVACADCHGPAHPIPWRVANGSAFDHNTTDTANAPVCFGCHADSPAGNPNNPHRPPTPAAAGTSPGCFNGTMCHNQPEVHPAGWVATSPAAQPHGDTAKMDGTVAGQGFPSCQTCHGNDFAGATVAPTCLNNATCHGAVASPHSPKPWRASAGSTYTHTTTVETGNAAVCAVCHFPGSQNNPPDHPATPAPDNTAPGCFNSTLCHGEAGAPHPLDNTWVTTSPAPQPHGNSAKAPPGATAGFAYCQECHGTGTTFPANFGGGSAQSCYSCHLVSAPHAPAPWRTSAGTTYTHTSTDGGNAPVCVQCHFPGSENNPADHPPTPAPPGTDPGCFNGTLCHTSPGS
jgi:hypothetical protein